MQAMAEVPAVHRARSMPSGIPRPVRGTPRKWRDAPPIGGARLGGVFRPGKQPNFFPYVRSSYSTTSLSRLTRLSLLRRLAQRRQFHSHSFISAEEPRFEGTLRTAQDPSYLIVVHLLILVQQNGGALLLRQGLNGAPNLFGAVPADQFQLDTGLPVGDFERRLVAFSIDRIIDTRTIDEDFRLTQTPIAQSVQRQVRGDP